MAERYKYHIHNYEHISGEGWERRPIYRAMSSCTKNKDPMAKILVLHLITPPWGTSLFKLKGFPKLFTGEI